MIVSSLSGCATDPNEPDTGEPRALTCAVLASQNCWKLAVAEAGTCAPAADVQGDLEPNTGMCRYGSGAVVDLSDTDLSAGVADRLVNFELTNDDGSLCADVRMPNQDYWELTTASGTVSLQYGATVRLTCPDGAVYTTGQLDLLRCAGDNNLPGWSGAFGVDNAQFALYGAGEREDLTPMFECWDEPWRY